MGIRESYVQEQKELLGMYVNDNSLKHGFKNPSWLSLYSNENIFLLSEATKILFDPLVKFSFTKE